MPDIGVLWRFRGNNLHHQYGDMSYLFGFIKLRKNAKNNECTKFDHFYTASFQKSKLHTYSSYCIYFDQLCWNYKCHCVIARMVDVSDYPLRFRGPSFRKTESPYDSEFNTLCEYSEFHKTLVSSERFCKTSYWENRYRHHCVDVGFEGWRFRIAKVVLFRYPTWRMVAVSKFFKPHFLPNRQSN